MKKLFSLTVVFSAAAFAQDFFQAPPQPPAPPQAREFNSVPFVGGTYLGVNLAEIDANRAKELKLKEDYGVEITRVEENSPAEKAGLKAGDVVQEYNGQRVEGMEQFGRMVRETPPGREVKLTISRNGATQTLAAVLGSRRSRFSVNFPPGFEMPAFHMPDIPTIYPAMRSAMLGVEAEALGDQLAGYFGVKEGVLVRSVLDNTPAQKAGMKAGDVITKVDGMTVTAPSELSSAVRSASSKKSYAVDLLRDHKPMTVTVTVEDRSERSIPRGRIVTNSN
ncbi:MAG: PDZ domain-containing protein [Bryobacteraceae bacterium]